MDIVQTQVIQAGIKFVLGLLTPVGAFIKAAMAIIDVVKFFIQRAAQIMELVKVFTDSIKAIASGNVGAVAKSIENALGRAVPVLIGFLVSLIRDLISSFDTNPNLEWEYSHAAARTFRVAFF